MGSQYSDGNLGPLSSSFTPVLRGSQDAAGVDNVDDDDLVPISVAVKVCPRSSKKQEEPSCIWLGSGGPNDGNSTLRCCGPSGEQHAFQFSSVYAEDTDQKTIFQQSLEPLLSVLMQGYDVCVIAYGQTGTGKSFTLSGPELDSQLEISESEFGLILRSIRYIFQSVTPAAPTGPVFSDDDESSIDASLYKETVCDLIMKVSFVKVDNQGVRDLLSDYGGKLSYRRQPDGVGIVLEGLKEVECNSTEEVWSLYQMGKKVFRGHSGMNPQQRGHTIFTLDLTILEKNCRKKSSLKFVELVPSDLLMLMSPTRSSVRQEMFSQAPCPQQVHQGTPLVEIGLLSLDGVVAALGDPRTKVSHAQFNNSLLTSLLRNAFGGPCVTLAICCISPSMYDAKQTLDTLTFAWRMSNIQNKPLPNVEPINIRQSMEEEINELMQANLNGSRRPSGMSELRSISATAGRMPDLVNNANIFPQYPVNNNSIWMNQDSLLSPIWQHQVNFQPQLIPQHVQMQQHLLQQHLLAQQALLQHQTAIQTIFPGSSSFPGLPQTGYYQDPAVINQLMIQHQLALQSRNRHQIESPFIPINAVSPMPEDVSPLSKQASPLPVSLYLQSNFGIHQQSSPLSMTAPNRDSERVLTPELDPVSLPVNLVPQIDEEDLQTERKKKAEARRSSLASQLKLTKILEESECEVSTPSANSSKLKGVATPQLSSDRQVSNDVDESGNSDVESNGSSEDFDSECSVCSDFEPNVENLVSKFEEETLKVIASHEHQYFELGYLKPVQTLNEVDDASGKVFKKSFGTEILPKNEFATSKSPSVQFKELYQNILAKQTLLDGMLSRDLELSSARRNLQNFARNLSEETTHIEQLLYETEKNLQIQSSFEKSKEVADLHIALNALRDKIKTVTDEDMYVKESDHANAMAYQHLQERLQLEESNKAFLFAELKQGKQIIDKLQNQLLSQEDHIRLSLQMSQELNQQRERLAMEEARLEQVRLETESLQKSLLFHQAELENRSKSLTKESHKQSSDGQIRNKDEIRGEVGTFREIRKSLVEEKKCLEHFLSHTGNLSHCKYCQAGVPRDTSGNRDSSQSKRAVEIDCLIEAVDCIIDYKSDILCGRNIDYTNNSDHPENAIMSMLCKLPVAECRALVHKFVLRCVDLRHDGAKHDEKVEQLLWELGVCHINDQDLRDQMSTMKFEYERQLEIQKREHKKKEALMSKCFKEQDHRKMEDQSVRHREARERRHRERGQSVVHSRKPTTERIVPGERKPSDTGSSELGAPDPSRVKQFQKLLQLNNAQTERSKVTHSGKKIIIEQP